MIRDKFVYDLGSGTMDPCYLANDAYEAARQSWLCTGCTQPKPCLGAIDVKLKQRPKDIAMNFVYGVGIGIIRRDLLQCLGQPAVLNDLMLGKVSAENCLVDNFLTFRGRAKLAIRGEARSTYRRCDICGRHLYYPLGKRYVLAGAPAEANVYESQLQSLIIGERIARQVQQSKWKELEIGTLPVLEMPLDGKPLFYSEEDFNKSK